ncbi:MAG: small subunit ribosomal protein S3 [Parcubacteria group bacterium Athens0714_25]|nr:MAG: small subunit ribosomal protein S3 [Parcubacteria group bacterium Athens0714_25]
MGKKVNPIAIRLGITTSWKSKWFGGRNFAKNLQEDVRIREAIMSHWKSAAIADVSIERRSGMTKVIILTSRPGMLIGRGGTGIEDINRLIKNKFFAGKKIDLKVEVKEIRQFEENAQLVAQQVAEQLEKRMPFRRVLKSTLEQVQKNNKIKGKCPDGNGLQKGPYHCILFERILIFPGRLPELPMEQLE